MPRETAQTLAERLLILTLALGQTEDQTEINALLDERQRTLDALGKAPTSPDIAPLLTQVMQAERFALQRFAEVRATAVRDLDRRSAGRRLPTTYAHPRPNARLIDRAG